MQTNIRLK